MEAIHRMIGATDGDAQQRWLAAIQAYDCGVWCFGHDEECPYTEPNLVRVWKSGFVAAAKGAVRPSG